MSVTRRKFLKYTVAGASALTLESSFNMLGSAMELSMGGNDISRSTRKSYKTIASTCAMCYDRCGILGFVDYGRLVKIGGNLEHPNSRGRLCAKGQAGINHLYDPDRILSPLKRTGKRGEGKWKKITWEEAYIEISARIKDAQKKGKSEDIFFLSERGISSLPVIKRFMNSIGSGSVLAETSIAGSNRQAAYNLTWGIDYPLPDFENSKYILLFGANPLEAGAFRNSLAQRVIDAKNKGRAKLVVFDVRITQTAGKTDEWIPVFPGTDAVVALAMANVIVKEDLHSKEFLKKWTNYSLENLESFLDKYTPEYAEKISGVSAKDIKRIAIEFASSKPSVAYTSGGVSKHSNGVYTERAILLLNAVAGAIDEKGGLRTPAIYDLPQPQPVPSEAKKSSKISEKDFKDREGFFHLLSDKKVQTQLLLSYSANPAYNFPDSATVVKTLQDKNLIPFHVAIDSFLTETAVQADIILPLATYLERVELGSIPTFNFTPAVYLRQPIVKPFGESKSLLDIFIELSKKLGGNAAVHFNFPSSEDYYRAVAARIESLAVFGGFDFLKEKGIWVEKNMAVSERSYEKKGFPTPSKKFEIFSTKLSASNLNPLPVYQQPSTFKNLKEGEFILTIYQSNVHTHSYTQNCMWLSEIEHKNPLLINSETAKAINLKTGDKVKIVSKAGSLVTLVKVTNGINPLVVAMADGFGHTEFGRVAKGIRFESDDPETRLIWWGNESESASARAIVPLNLDPVGGGQGWMETRVIITKA